LDLTVEAEIVENKRWHSFFSDDVLRKARKRLLEYRYVPRWLQVSFLEREYVVVAHHNAERIVPEDRHAHCGDGAALEDTAEAFIRGGDVGVGRIVLLLFQLIRANCARCTGRLRVRCKTDP